MEDFVLIAGIPAVSYTHLDVYKRQANVLMNRLLKHTQLQDTFGVIMLALVNNEPRILNLKQMLEYLSLIHI